MDIQVELRPLLSMWALVACFHLLKASFGVAPGPFNSLDSHVKIPNHFLVRIEFEFNPKINQTRVLCSSVLYLNA